MTDKFEITNKVFKIVADQAANIKCAFKNTTSSEPLAVDLEEKEKILIYLNL